MLPMNPVGTQSAFLKYSYSKPENLSHCLRHAIIADNTSKGKQLSYINLQLNRCETTNAIQTGNIRMIGKIEKLAN